jgi:glycosyltransferase 2 family protein
MFEVMVKSTLKQSLTILAKYGIGVALLAFVISRYWEGKPGPNGEDAIGLKVLFSRPIDVPVLILGIIISSSALVLTFLRWHLLVVAVGLPFKRRDAISLGLAGYFFNTFLPGSVGGDLWKAYAMSREQERRTVAVSTVIFDRLLGLWALVLFLAILGGAFWLYGHPLLTGDSANGSMRFLLRISFVIVLTTALVWAMLSVISEARAEKLAHFWKKVPLLGGSISEVWRATWAFHRAPKALALAVILALISHTGWILTFHCGSRLFKLDDQAEQRGSLVEHILIVPVGMTITAGIPTPGGVGGGEAAFSWLYSLLHKPEAFGIAMCLGWRIFNWSVGIIGYFIYLRLRSRSSPENSPSVSPEAS